jgi:methylated-DNA-protein-cysteine methyltransferase-like protein
VTDKQRQQSIWQQVAAIPPGRVATYGQIAQLAGYPGYARYVGALLKALPADSEIPWHRVINAKGELAFAVDSEAYQRQKSRLVAEGVLFEGRRIRLADFAW